VSQSWMIGDILNDVEAGNRAGCKSILIDNGNETEWLKGDCRTPDFITPNFMVAAKEIASYAKKEINVNAKQMERL
jgi:D-glycero-D-manno-heptose 1,7-bisphosphate phosphatase